MRVGILEWICGGGLCDTEPSEVSDSLCAEGWSMLSNVANDLAASGHEVWMAIDSRLVTEQQLAKLHAGCRIVTAVGRSESLPVAWWKLASTTDATIVIAPELSGVLEAAVAKLKPISKLLCNSHGEFLANSCDKWRTAQCLAQAGVPHPATQLLNEVTPAWLQQHTHSTGKWIVKPRDGAGCEGIKLVDRAGVVALQVQLPDFTSASRWIVQPFLDGLNFSRAAVVNCSSRASWLPLVTQEFLVAEKMTYRGGYVLRPYADEFMHRQVCQAFSIPQLDALLNSSLTAMGSGAYAWVGFDLLYSRLDQRWFVIEVNPRLTTSFTGLTIAGGPGLMDKLLRACAGKSVAWEGTWNAVDFHV